MPVVPLTIRVSPELHSRLEADRISSGVPTVIFLRRAAEAALDAKEGGTRRKSKPTRKPSLN